MRPGRGVEWEGFLSNPGVGLLLGEVLDGRGKQSPHWAVL